MMGNTLAMWFRRRLGFVTGMAGVINALATAGVPALYLWLIGTFGWRGAWIVLGVGTWVLLLPIMAFVFRNGPGDVGQHTDGAASDSNRHDGASAGQTADETSFTLSGARRTRAYWCLLALSGAHGMVFAAVMFNHVQIFEANRLTAGNAATMFLLFGACSAAAQLLAGLLADRVPLNLMLVVSSVAATAGLVVLVQADGLAGGYAFGCLYGLSVGTEVVGRNTAWPIFFGTRHLGKIKGSAAMVTVIGSSLGPFIVGASPDSLGGYGPAILLMAGVYGAVAVAMLFAARPRGV
jgi:cyanate permease